MKSCQRGTGADEPQRNTYSLFPQVEIDFRPFFLTHSYTKLTVTLSSQFQ